jgi:UDP-N-acetylglucosamine 4,6-dehydratase/UDP-glucose 4-epimerase
MKIRKGKKYLITGASGFLGKNLTKKILDLGGEVVAISRNEGNLLKLKNRFPAIKIITGSIANPVLVDKCFAEDIEGVFHLAAYKHVSMAEKHTLQCCESNIIGSINVLNACRKFRPKFVITTSTDKAASLAGVYGASKYIVEKLFCEYQKANKKTKHRVVRYGNVLYSTGSVLCKWRRLLKRGDEVVVTDPNATRFFWSIDQAIDLIFNCLENAEGPEPYVPEMKSIKIKDLLKAMAEKYLPEGEKLKIKIIGLQEGENLHERIIKNGPSSNEYEKFKVSEIKKII